MKLIWSDWKLRNPKKNQDNNEPAGPTGLVSFIDQQAPTRLSKKAKARKW